MRMWLLKSDWIFLSIFYWFPGESLSFVRRRPCAEISLAGGSVIWQWQGDDKVSWQCYSLDVGAWLEDAYRRGVSILDLDRPPIKMPYTIDLRSMQQVRNGSRFKRNIRRHVDSVSYKQENSYGAASAASISPGLFHSVMQPQLPSIGLLNFGQNSKSPDFAAFQFSSGAPFLPASSSVNYSSVDISQPQMKPSVFCFQAGSVACPSNSGAVPMASTSTSNKSGSSHSVPHKGRERKLKIAHARWVVIYFLVLSTCNIHKGCRQSPCVAGRCKYVLCKFLVNGDQFVTTLTSTVALYN